jgi:predicted amidohydrolase YtcJ
VLVNFSAEANHSAPDLILYNGKFSLLARAADRRAGACHQRRAHFSRRLERRSQKTGGEKTRFIDLRRERRDPGFNDAHNHFAPKPPGFHLQLTDWNRAGGTIEALKNAVPQSAERSMDFGEIGGNVIAEADANHSRSTDRAGQSGSARYLFRDTV